MLFTNLVYFRRLPRQREVLQEIRGLFGDKMAHKPDDATAAGEAWYLTGTFDTDGYFSSNYRTFQAKLPTTAQYVCFTFKKKNLIFLTTCRMFTVRVTLDDVSKPPVWRQINVPDDVTLTELHRIIQRAMGWQNCHLHKFFTNEEEEDGHEGVMLALPLLMAGTQSRAAGPKCRAKEHLLYEYDMGASWLHIITLEKVNCIPENKSEGRSVALVKAKGACPPEDVGGSVGFHDFKEIIADPDHEAYIETAEWLMEMTGYEEFDPHHAPRPQSWLI
jgi:hypothetical protein